MIIENVNHIKLLNESTSKSIMFTTATNDMKYNEQGSNLSNTCNMTIDFSNDTDMMLVQSIIEEHDPTPLPIQLSQQDLVNNLGVQVAQLKLQIIMMKGVGQ